MRKPIILILLCTSVLLSGCGGGGRLNSAAPSVLPSTGRQMKTAGFWINQQPSPDDVIMNSSEITAFNGTIENKLKLIRDITKLPDFYGKDLTEQFNEEIKKLRRKGLYFESGKKAGGRFYKTIKKNMALDQLPFRIKPLYGFVVHYANQRILPSEDGLNKIQKDVDFDELQNSSLDVGTPVAIIHVTSDGEWFYTVSSQSAGWVKKSNIAVCELEDVNKYFANSSFVVVTAPKADLFSDEGMTEYYDYARMGVAFPSTGRTNKDAIQITCPTREKNGILSMKPVYIKENQTHKGYLPYTARTIMEQAFELLNQPYGWGGMYGEQDCSAFLQEIFATVGIYLPRNSADQAKVGRLLAQFEKENKNDSKIELLKKEGIGGTTILALDGHIMLYLGVYKNNPYVIHSTWAYRERGDTVRVLNRVVVSDLYLGEGSSKGSLLKRLTSIRSIEK